MTRGVSSPGLGAAMVAAVVMAAVAAACSRPAPARFPHRLHLVELKCGKPGEPECLKCNGCHTPRQRERIHKLPGVALCQRCHEDDTEGLARVIAAKPDRPFGHIEFDHDRHLEMGPIEGQCVPCHAGVVEKGKPNVPPMSRCLSCHEHEKEFREGQCSPCHGAADLSKVLPQTFMSHQGAFMRRHGTLARLNEPLCSACHAQSDCDDCHDMTQILTVEQRQPERIQRQFVHRGDFMVRHAIEAQSQPSRCVRCHEPETCDSCHIQRGVSGNRVDGRNPHPPGWVGTNTGASTFHGQAARRDILLCASCHDQGPATNCIRCHRVGGYGGNPHPSGWRSLRSVHDTMCQYCHE